MADRVEPAAQERCAHGLEEDKPVPERGDRLLEDVGVHPVSLGEECRDVADVEENLLEVGI